MSGHRKVVWIAVSLVIVGLLLLTFEVLYRTRGQSPQSPPATAGAPGGSGPGQRPGPAEGEAGSLVQRPIPNPPEAKESAAATALPPSPPLPQVPRQTTEEQRKKLFQLEGSVDHVVAADEPFEAGGERLTIQEIQQRLGKAPGAVVAMEQAAEAEPGTNGIRRPIPEPEQLAYYGVRRVRSGENIWRIHFQVLRDYFSRRQVELPPTADRPEPSGRSSGIGRLLKFLEGVVQIYDVKARRLVRDPNLVQPEAVIVFFRISEVFTTLDRLQPEDLRALRLVRRQMVLDRGAELQGLLRQDQLR